MGRVSKRASFSCILLILAGALCFPAPHDASAALSDRVSETTLSNGLKVILLENHKAPLVTFQVWYKVGSRNEAWGKTGLSHILEHMMFKGTKNVGPGEFSRTIEQNGGDDNAFTSTDFTAYFEDLSADRVTIPISLESDRMGGLLLKEEEFKPERNVVMEERRLRTDDNPRAVLMEQLNAAAFQVQPYHWPVIGWMQDITRFTIEDLREHYHSYYSPANAVVVVVGDFKKEMVLPLIEQAFGAIRGGQAPDQKRDMEEPQLGERRIVVKKEAQLASVVKAYHVPNVRQRDGYVLEVIEALLSAGESSRLNRLLVREKQLALAVGADNEFLSRDPSLFTISAEVMPGKTSDDVEKALVGEIERLQRELVGPRELEKAKNQLESAFVYGQDSLFYQGMILASYEVVSTWKDIDKYVPGIRSVSASDVRLAARKYLVPANCTTGVLVPIPSANPKPAQPASPSRENIVR